MSEQRLGERAAQVKLTVEDLLLVLNASKVSKDDFIYGGYPLPLRNFDRVDPIGFASPEMGIYSDVSDLEILCDVTPSDLPGAVDVCCAALENNQESNLIVRRFRTIKRPLMPVKRFARVMIAEEVLHIDRASGIGRTSINGIWGTNGGDVGSWMDLQRGCRAVDSPRAAHITGLQIGLGIQFGRDYLWHAYLKWPGSEIGVMFPTTPHGARELFKLRDYEAGESRRRALIHWVSGHTRRIRKDTIEESRVWVREHVRGRVAFDWQDMQGAIYPAPYDLRRIAAE